MNKTNIIEKNILMVTLIVDDSEQMRALTELALNGVGIYKISKAFNGIDALNKLKKENFDLIIMDWQMPEMDGLTCTKIIRNGENNINPEIPIILLSDVVGDDNILIAKSAGVNFYIEKPFNMKTLYNAILMVMSYCVEKYKNK